MDAAGSGRKRARSASSASGDEAAAVDVGDEAQADAGADANATKRLRTEVCPREPSAAVVPRSRCPPAQQAAALPAEADAEVRSQCAHGHGHGGSLATAQAEELPASVEAVAQPELLSPGATIALADVHDVILHALDDTVAPKWIRLQVCYASGMLCFRYVMVQTIRKCARSGCEVDVRRNPGDGC